ncbi:MAG: exodeoxyribonuclease V subunit gamma, partial [Holophagales bacterium]|nr:exodeoxyribonuclease V subunit gamma [Holophagales bacterium]
MDLERPEPGEHRRAGLSLVTSNRLDRLADRLAGELAAAPLPPLEREVVVVQSQGMQRWLTLHLARRRGIAASLTTPFPRPFCHDLAGQVLDPEELRRPPSEEIPRRERSLFGRELLTWRLFSLLGRLDSLETGGDRRFAPPAAYLRDDPDQRKRFQLATRLAALFDDYQIFRPRMLASWAAGGDLPEGSAASDRAPGALRGSGWPREALAAARWQAPLWRRLLRPPQDRDPRQEGSEEPLDQRLARLIELLATADAAPAGLPRRLTVLGVSSLPPMFVELLAALSRFLPVSVYFLSPTWHFWGDLRSEKETARLRRRLRGRGLELDLEGQHFQEGHPLLAALGRQGRDFFSLLQEADTTGAAWHELDFHDPAPEPASAPALAVLQSDILHLRQRPDCERLSVAPGDDSLEIHCCHSPLREMEALRDRLLDAFERDPELRPSEVLVLVPDVERYAPYIQAVFGVERPGTPELPFSIADRKAGREQPPSESFLTILDLIAARLTVRQVFDLLDVPAIRHRFELRAEELPELERRVADSGVRWGLDGARKARVFGLPGEPANTWRAGLDRLLMGYATGDLEDELEAGSRVEVEGKVDGPAGGRDGPVDGMVLGISPLSGDTAALADAVGRLAAFVDTLGEQLERLEAPRSPELWAHDLTRAVDALMRADDEAEERGLQLVRDAAHELGEMAGRAGVTEDLDLRVVQELLGRRLDEEGFGSGFVNGRITFCALRPMRTIPFRFLAIAGLDDGAFPRRDSHRSFDLMAQLPRPGDRSLRDDDRHLFLETLLAAERRLFLSYVGRSQRDSSEKEPSTVLSELLDHLDRTFAGPDGGEGRRAFVIEHPLQPWSPAYFTAASADTDRAEPQDRDGRAPGRRAPLYSYSADDALGASALLRPPEPPPPFVAGPLASQAAPGDPPSTAGGIEIPLADLLRFWRSPARWFCRQQLGIELEPAAEEIEEHEPFELGGLDAYQLRQWLLHRRLGRAPAGVGAVSQGLPGAHSEADLRLLRARGQLPAGEPGDVAYGRLYQRVESFASRVPAHTPMPPRQVEVTGEGWLLGGWVDGLTSLGLLRFRSASLRPWDLLSAWIEQLALAADNRRRAAEPPAAPAAPPTLPPAMVIGEDDTIHLAAPD